MYMSNNKNLNSLSVFNKFKNKLIKVNIKKINYYSRLNIFYFLKQKIKKYNYLKVKSYTSNKKNKNFKKYLKYYLFINRSYLSFEKKRNKNLIKKKLKTKRKTLYILKYKFYKDFNFYKKLGFLMYNLTDIKNFVTN